MRAELQRLTIPREALDFARAYARVLVQSGCMPGDITKKLPAGNRPALLWSAPAPSPKRKVPDKIVRTSGFGCVCGGM